MPIIKLKTSLDSTTQVLAYEWIAFQLNDLTENSAELQIVQDEGDITLLLTPNTLKSLCLLFKQHITAKKLLTFS